ncbi:MAG TPA: serine/threonine protein kinase [Burkholderiales bacterium]|nr:serine/threonine protein kinase [Burkholderiales bacterium]
MDAHPYSLLTPDRVLDAIAACGLRPDGRLLSLNSYENRVYQAWLEDGTAVVAKFYRPGRWTDAQIDEEHAFARELAEREIPVVAPLTSIKTGTDHVFRVAIYPRRGGRSPELGDDKTLEWIGRFIGRIHGVGAIRKFHHREALTPKTFGHDPRAFLLGTKFIPVDLLDAWKAVTAQALAGVERCYANAGQVRAIRLHGDCHVGNILWTDDGPHFVDLDDARMGPALQDLWMLLSGTRAAMGAQMHHVLAGYEEFAEFDRRELHLLEALRTLRLIHYSAWIARRWDDPAFPAAFPWFNTQRYWQDRILELREQIALMEEEPLAVD